MVYKDSAMEAFFQFEPEQYKSYINLELNSAGILRAQFGETRDERTFFNNEQMAQCKIQCGKEPIYSHAEEKTLSASMWWVQILLPLTLIEVFYGKIEVKEGSRLRCNFFKLSETAEIEHYASYTPIAHPVPNFHMPEFFAEAEVCG